MTRVNRKKGGKLLSSTRPRNIQGDGSVTHNLSSKATRTLIRSHHNLHKKLRSAEREGNDSLANSLKAQIETSGGIDAYQKASIQGQSAARGGDSSKVLVDWLRELGVEKPSADQPPLRLLEVGSLKVDNACAKSGLFDMVRIDLNSQHKEILEQDFMERRPPGPGLMETDGFDVVSLSLVVNYVPDAEGRGQMLLHTTKFLRKVDGSSRSMPGLFLVLPAPCVHNSRYMSPDRLLLILEAIGYRLLKSKTTNKLVYYYFVHADAATRPVAQFRKEVIRDAKGMNNFAIVLK